MCEIMYDSASASLKLSWGIVAEIRSGVWSNVLAIGDRPFRPDATGSIFTIPPGGVRWDTFLQEE